MTNVLKISQARSANVSTDYWDVPSGAMLSFRGVTIKLSRSETLVAWHLCVAGVLRPDNVAEVVPPHHRNVDGSNLQRAANQLRNRLEFRNNDVSCPLTWAYHNNSRDGVAFKPGVKVDFRYE